MAESMKQHVLYVSAPPDLYRATKIAAAAELVTIGEFVRRAVATQLKLRVSHPIERTDAR